LFQLWRRKMLHDVPASGRFTCGDDRIALKVVDQNFPPMACSNVILPF
jgi:hypothetical protein